MCACTKCSSDMIVQASQTYSFTDFHKDLLLLGWTGQVKLTVTNPVLIPQVSQFVNGEGVAPQ